ncbi:MAG: class I SAM-dependent DNA methyltransferase [Candidatus Heimdallarchaeota archaeon]
MKWVNVYEDTKRAEAYAKLEYPGTYYLAFRDLPGIIAMHVKGKDALDFGCGTGRSTRFLQNLGFNSIGVDIAENMIKKARKLDPRGDYRLLDDGTLSPLNGKACDLVLSAFTFDNIPTMEKKVQLFRELGTLLKSEGRIINLVSTPEIYTNEWASFTTKKFPANREAKSGDTVKIVVTDLDDNRPVEDVLWTDEDYQETFKRAGLEVIKIFRPLAKENEPYPWVNETKIAPWVIYLLKRAQDS